MSDRPSDKLLAADYLVALTAFDQQSAIHPRQKENAISWVRLCSLRATRDPSAWLSSPWRNEIVEAAVEAVRETVAGPEETR